MRQTICAAGVIFAIHLVAAPAASAAIIKVQSAQSCNVNGLDASTAAAQGGVHCDNGNPFSLEALLDGTLALYIGNSQTPSWNFINDTGHDLTSLSLYYSGALSSNSFLDMQVSGTTLFGACTSTTANNISRFDAHCGTGDITPNNPLLPVLLMWSAGDGLAQGHTFNLGTASFAHAGADAGCISGTSNCQSVPDSGSTLALLCLSLGLMAIGMNVRRNRATSRVSL